MRTYISIDCDYFTYGNKSPIIQAKRLLHILEILDKPVYVTLGHDLHAFDVNRHRIERLINIDAHCDCYFSVNEQLMELYVYSLESFQQMEDLQSICESNWTHFCRLVGDDPCIEHWHPEDIYHNDTYTEEQAYCLRGPVDYYNRDIVGSDLCKRIKRIKDVVAVGVALSPFWCAHNTQRTCNWNELFFDILREHPAFADPTLYSGNTDRLSQIILKDGKQNETCPRKKTEIVPGIWFHPVRNGCYTLSNGAERIRISTKGVTPHFPSIKRAAEAFSQWTPLIELIKLW